MLFLSWILMLGLMVDKPSPDWPGLLEQGEEVVKNLPEVRPGSVQEICLEQTVQGNPVGYCSSTIEGQEHQGKLVWLHRVEMVVAMPQATIAGEVVVYADRALRPVQVVMRRKVKPREGEMLEQKQSFTFKDALVEAQSEANGQTQTASERLPADPFVFPVSLMIDLSDVTKLKSFAVLEFNPDRLKLERVQADISHDADGTILVRSFNASGKPDLVLRYGRDGKLLSHREAAVPMEGRPIDRERAAQLKRKFGRFADIGSRPAP